MSAVITREPEEWISISVVGFVVMVINALILRKELKKESSVQTVSISKYLNLWCKLCIICGILWGFVVFVRFFPFFCHFGGKIFFTFSGLQGAFIGFYQLSRLYYCFSATKVYSNKGYPDWLFIFMYIIGIALILTVIIYPWFFVEGHIQCGINKKNQYYPLYPGLGYFGQITNISWLTYISWDFLTFLLYIIKLISFRKYAKDNVDIYKRIRNILYRIIILTILYEATVIISIVISLMYNIIKHNTIYLNILTWTVWGIQSIAWSYGVYLMQNHNTNQYESFLKILYYLKCHYICCICCKSIIIDQLDLDISQLEKVVNRSRKSTETNNTNNTATTTNDNTSKTNKIEDTMDETKDVSVKQTHSHIEQISFETTVIAQNQNQ